MSALATDTPRVVKGMQTYSYKIKNASQIYVGSFCSIDSTGYAIPFAGAAQEKLVGRALPTPVTALTAQLLGNTSPAANTQIPEVTIAMDEEVLPRVSVTGATAITDIGTVVYLNSTDNDLTFTRPTRGAPFGIVSRWITGATVDVQRFSKLNLDMLGLSGQATQTIFLASHTGADVTTATGYAVPAPACRWALRTFKASVTKALAGGTSIVYQSQIGGVSTTGGALTLNTVGGTGGTAGDSVSCTAITALNVGSENSALTLLATVTGSFTGTATISIFGTFDLKTGI